METEDDDRRLTYRVIKEIALLTIHGEPDVRSRLLTKYGEHGFDLAELHCRRWCALDSPEFFEDWCDHLRQIGLYQPGSMENWRFAKQQWKLYWAGERGPDLHDAVIYLIDKYG